MQWACKRLSKAIEIRNGKFCRNTSHFPTPSGYSCAREAQVQAGGNGEIRRGEKANVSPVPSTLMQGTLTPQVSRYRSHLGCSLAFGSQWHCMQQGNLFPGYTVAWNIVSQELIATAICLSTAVTAGSWGAVGHVLQLCALWGTRRNIWPYVFAQGCTYPVCKMVCDGC